MDEPTNATPRAVVGLLDASGAAGGSAGGAAWDLIFHLAAWRYADEGATADPNAPIHTSRVRCLVPTPKDDISDWMQRLRPYGTVELLAAPGAAEAGLVLGGRIVTVDPPDASLLRHGVGLRQPITLDHPVFGRFRYDRRFDWYEITATWLGQTIELRLETGVPDPDAPAVRATLAHAEALFADQEEWRRRVNAFAVARLLPLKNETWLDEDEDGNEEHPLDAAGFVARMELESIQVDPDGNFTFWHDDGELFFGHAIQVDGTLADGPTRADIPG